MNEENKIPNETKKEKPNEITKKEEKITIKKSIYNNMLKGVIAIPILLILTVGISLQEVEADLVPEEAYLVEGTGFAVTEDSIKISEMDFLVELDRQVGTRASLVVQDGFVTLGDMDFFVSDVTGTVLNDGRFIRIVGTASNDFGDEVSISFFW